MIFNVKRFLGFFKTFSRKTKEEIPNLEKPIKKRKPKRRISVWLPPYSFFQNRFEDRAQLGLIAVKQHTHAVDLGRQHANADS